MLALRVAVITAGACLLVGCNSSPPNGGQTNQQPIGGLVTYNGQPLIGATVEYHPAPNNTAWGGIGTTGPDGRYTVSNHKGGGGLSPGDYRVTVSRYTHKDGTPLREDEGYFNIPGVLQTVPAMYTDPGKTPLLVKVTTDKPIPDLALSGK